MWGVFRGDGEPHDSVDKLPAPPPWRAFQHEQPRAVRGALYQAGPDEVELVNAALYLRRPLLITGKPGVGKSSLAYAVAHELRLGPVLSWSITTRSTLVDGLYSYDAIGRLQEANLHRIRGRAAPAPSIGRYIQLGPLGTALLPSPRPRVLLVDEVDKSDIDLPNDLLHVFEEAEFRIPELARLPEDQRVVDVMTWDGDQVTINDGVVRAQTYPLVIFTSNGERDFPAAFLRRCLRVTMQPPDEKRLLAIVQAHLGLSDPAELEKLQPLIEAFLKRRDAGDLATDQLLNAIYLATHRINPLERETLINAVLRSLTE